MAKHRKLVEAVEADAALQLQMRHEREIGSLKRKFAGSEQKRLLLEAELEESGERGEFLDATGKLTPAYLPFVERKAKGNATGVFLFGDWHCEENVDPDTINGKNRFNLDICAKRVQNTAQRACQLLDAQRGMSKIEDGVISLIGDMITGHIHEDLAESNWLSPIEASLFCQDQIAGLIDYLLAHSGCKTFTVVTNFGNHGRVTKNIRSATAAKQSYEWLMYNQIARYYRNEPRIKWKIERGIHNYLDIQGKTVRFHHGDKIKYNGGSGGIVVPATKALAGWDATTPAAYTFFGHFHSHEKHPHFTLCNCLIGFNSYALDIKARFSEPSQTLAVFDRSRPGPVLVQEIYCDKPGKVAA